MNLDLTKYFSQTKYIPDLKIDIVYCIADDFYYGPKNNFSEKVWQEKRDPLSKPSKLFLDSYLLSDNCEWIKQELVDYYSQIISSAKKHWKKIESDDLNFRICPIIYTPDNKIITFPWHDKLEECISTLSILTSNETWQIEDDVHQWWQFWVYADEEKFYFVERDWEEDISLSLFNCDKKKIAQMTKTTITRIQSQIDYLSSELGENYWIRTELNKESLSMLDRLHNLYSQDK